MEDRSERGKVTRNEQISVMSELRQLVHAAQTEIQNLQAEIASLHGQIQDKQTNLATVYEGFPKVVAELESMQFALHKLTIERPESAAIFRPHELEVERYIQELNDLVNSVIPRQEKQLSSDIQKSQERAATLQEIQTYEQALSEQLQTLTQALGNIDLS